MQRQQHPRINLGHLKAEIVKKLGVERSKLYFFYVNRLLSLKISKVEFNKICFRIFGRENIALHNQLITSILRNAYQAKVPPEVHGKEVCKTLDAAGGYDCVAPSDELQQTRSCNDKAQILNSSVLLNGSILPLASHKADIFSSHSKEVADASYIPVLENGNANLSAAGELQHHQVLQKQLGSRGEVIIQDSNKLPVVRGSEDNKLHACIRDSTKIADGTGVSTRSLLQAPLGVPLCAFNTNGARRALALASSGRYVSSYDCGGLLDSENLRERMEQIAVNEGLQCVSLDCAKLLNNALDSCLKRLIKSAVELVGKGSTSDLPLSMTYKNPVHGNLANRLLPSSLSQIQSSYRPMDGILQEQRIANTVSFLDFNIAMELNPQQLGEDRPLLLEKMCFQSSRD